MPHKLIDELDAFLHSLSNPALRHKVHIQIDRLRRDMRQSALRDESDMAADEATALLMLYRQADAAAGNPARIASALQKLRRRFPESEELYDELFAVLTENELTLPVAAPAFLHHTPVLPARPRPEDDQPWALRLRNRVFGSVPAIIVRLSESLVESLMMPAPALQGAVVRGHEDEWDVEQLKPVMAQEVRLDGRDYFAELFARNSGSALEILAGLTGDEPLPAHALVHLRIGRTSRSAGFGCNGTANLGKLPFDLLAKGGRANPIELVFELPHSGAR